MDEALENWTRINPKAVEGLRKNGDLERVLRQSVRAARDEIASSRLDPYEAREASYRDLLDTLEPSKELEPWEQELGEELQIGVFKASLTTEESPTPKAPESKDKPRMRVIPGG